MKVKIIVGANEKELEQKINDFISRPNVKIVGMKFAGTGFDVSVFSVMFVYNEC